MVVGRCVSSVSSCQALSVSRYLIFDLSETGSYSSTLRLLASTCSTLGCRALGLAVLRGWWCQFRPATVVGVRLGVRSARCQMSAQGLGAREGSVCVFWKLQCPSPGVCWLHTVPLLDLGKRGPSAPAHLAVLLCPQ